MKLYLKSAAVFAAVASSALIAACANNGTDKPGTTTLAAPDNLRALNVTATSATLSWNSVADADSYIVRFDDEIIPVDKTTYEPTGLTSETEYKWSVAAVRGDKNSVWAESTFTTIESRVRFVYSNGAYYGRVHDGVDLEVFNLLFLGFDPKGGDINGHELMLELLVDPSLVDPAAESFDIPAGTYEVSVPYNANTVNLGSSYTVLSLIEDSYYTEDYVITGGKFVVEGDRNNYKMKMDIECLGGGMFKGSYEGPLSVAPALSNTIEMGEMTFATPLEYFQGPIDGKNVDAYMFHASDSGVSFVDNKWVGSGWALFSAQFNTALESGGGAIPDGTYTVSATPAPGTIMAGYSTGSGRAGLWAYDIEGGSIQRRYAITKGTVTSTFANGSYTIVLDCEDDDGYLFTGTVTGAPKAGSGRRAH